MAHTGLKIGFCLGGYLGIQLLIAYYVNYETDKETSKTLEKRDFKPNDISMDKPMLKYPPYKIYIYDMPTIFNKDLVLCTGTRSLTNQGYGNKISESALMTVRDTWQFSLELIIHNNLLASPYRTLNQSQADVFYIPFYSSMYHKCRKARTQAQALKRFFMSKIENGKPHTMTLGKIEREHVYPRWSVLKSEIAKNITFIGIEEECDGTYRKKSMTSQRPLVVAPYPSFGHLFPLVKQSEVQNLYKSEQRNIFMLFVGKPNPWSAEGIRNKILGGNNIIKIKTKQIYQEYNWKAKNMKYIKYVNLQIINEDFLDHLPSWIRQSVFCLQPAGDSPTRKSFYDAILFGCIPVIFNNKLKVRYPFEDRIDYKQLVVKINANDFNDSVTLFNILKTIDEKTIQKKRYYMNEVMKYLQYSYPILIGSKHNDAIQYILDEIGTRYNLQ